MFKLVKFERKYFLILLVVFFLFLVPKFNTNQRLESLMKDTKYQTPIYYLNENNNKIKIVIVAGIHGNEIAGVKAVEKIIEEKYNWAEMILIPKANIEAYKSKVRNPYYMSDLNRSFPGKDKGTDTELLAKEIFNIIEKEKPDFVLDLHEWNKAYDEDEKKLDNGLIFNSTENKLWKSGEKIYNEYGDTKTNNMLTLNLGSPNGSLNKEIWEFLNIPVLTIESNMSESLDQRIDFHLQIIKKIIKNYEMD